ncbi:MAG TPA: SGNH/GDSL hydrolase family protein, partial [Ruminococcus sp.]|nr:SGNH/GDSL hydrolase family protein [Ruminococcus sp.]
PNADFYQNRIVVFGDSIAYGFNAYGYVPYEHNLAKESVSMWNMGAFTFDKGGGEMSMTDAAAYISPSLIYMSLGMNDVPGLTPEDFAGRYRGVIEELQEKIPGVSIVVAGITPVSASCTYTSCDTIRGFNSALEQMVADMGSDHVWYFDAYSVCADPYDLTLRGDASGGDGIHLNSGTYGEIFGALFNFLDMTPVMDNMLAVE